MLSFLLRRSTSPNHINAKHQGSRTLVRGSSFSYKLCLATDRWHDKKLIKIILESKLIFALFFASSAHFAQLYQCEALRFSSIYVRGSSFAYRIKLYRWTTSPINITWKPSQSCQENKMMGHKTVETNGF